MMKTIELEKEEIYCGNLLLVNKNYLLRDNNVKGLVPADVRFPNILMKRDVANVLQLIFEKISAKIGFQHRPFPFLAGDDGPHLGRGAQ